MQQPSHDTFDRDLLQQQLLQRVIAQFISMKYSPLDAGGEQHGPLSITGRKHDSEVILPDRLWVALRRLNPGKPEQLLNQAFNELTRDLSLLGGIGANKQVHQWLKNGYKPAVAQRAERSTNDEEQEQDQRPDSDRVSIIHWSEPEENEFLLVQNFYVSSESGRIRLDLVGFINGLPLILPLCRLINLYDLYHGQLAEYKRILPRLFWYNACILLSNGPVSKLGSVTASWEFFFEWKRLHNKQYDVITPDSELDTSLERMLQEVCAPKRLLDLVENFILYSAEKGSTIKLIARNHQYLGVNAVFDRVERHGELKGKLGVFWHTQGSGKSYSMVFLKQKIQRLLRGGWTFVIVTDREDLDTQIYQTFQRAGVVPKGKTQVHATDSEHLRRMLQKENHEVVFTLIQKFRTEKPGQQYQTLSTRDNIIVIADEAHRTQYDTFAQNMLDGLPNASFLGFTGTPLIQQEKQATRERFGDYVSVYNFSDAIRDGITVPLFYENHTPEMVLNNPEFAEAVQQLITDNILDDEQERRLSTRLLREYSILTNDERLDWIADDIVAHFMGRGYMGKAMVVSVDKPTVVRMYDKVQRAWQQELARLQDQRLEESNPRKQIELDHKITYMLETDMAVIISGVAPDDKRFDRYGLDPAPHIQRMERENLDEAFKRQDNLCLLADSGQKALRIVFVCGMWITGFDVPCLSTLYLDRPMQGHTLMQAIARANRVYDREKIVGMIIDYVGSFNDLLKALAIYATSDASATLQDVQIGDKSALISQLENALHETDQFCTRQNINIPRALQALSAADTTAERQSIILDIVDRLLENDDSKIGFLVLAAEVSNLYKAILPDKDAGMYMSHVHLLWEVATKMYEAIQGMNIDEVLDEARDLIETSIDLTGYVRETAHDAYLPEGHFDLSKIDYDALAQSMHQDHPNIKAEQLRAQLTQRLEQMVRQNPTRVDYQEKLNQIVHKNNDNSANYSLYPQELIDFARRLHEEELRAKREGLSEEGLAIFDLLTRIDQPLSPEDREQVKSLTKELLASLKREEMGIEWQKKQQTSGAIDDNIKKILGRLPAIYDEATYNQKCVDVFHYTLTHFEGPGAA